MLQERPPINKDSSGHILNGSEEYTAFEFSYLSDAGLPQVVIIMLSIDCRSKYYLSTQKLKRFFNDFAMRKFQSLKTLKAILIQELKSVFSENFRIYFLSASEYRNLYNRQLKNFLSYQLIDASIWPDLSQSTLKDMPAQQPYQLIKSHLLRFVCQDTGQPYWGSLYIKQYGHPIDPRILLNYLQSIRNHLSLPAYCTELIFQQIIKLSKAKHLDLNIIYGRKGGIGLQHHRSYRQGS